MAVVREAVVCEEEAEEEAPEERRGAETAEEERAIGDRGAYGDRAALGRRPRGGGAKQKGAHRWRRPDAAAAAAGPRAHPGIASADSRGRH